MKSWIVIGMIGMMAPASISHADEGTGVGTGGYGAYQIELARMKRDLKSRMIGQQLDYAEIASWCSKVTSFLKKELKRADRFMESDPILAKRMLADILKVAADSISIDPNFMSPITKKLIDRGVIYDDVLEDALEKGGAPTPLDTVTELHFLYNYINFIIETEEQFDRRYYVPYHYRDRNCRHCEDNFDYPAFTNRYMTYATDQLNFVMKHFVGLMQKGGATVPYPVGKPEAFLYLAQYTTGYVAEDLAGSLEAFRYSCVINDLQTYSATLRDYNYFDDRSMYRTPREAFVSSVGELQGILGNMGCGDRYPNPHHGNPPYEEPRIDDPKELLTSSISIYDNDLKVVKVEPAAYVETIYVKAESAGRDATVDVMVNGKVKGTIHIPASDPLYVVTIAQRVSSIQFMKKGSGGTVTIKSIQAIGK